EHIQQRKRETLLDRCDLLEGKRTLVELTIFDPARDNAVDQFVDTLRRGLFQSPARGLDRVGEKDDRAFTKLRFGTVVAVGALTDLVGVARRAGRSFAAGNLFL